MSKKVNILLILCSLLFFLGFTVLFFHGEYHNKILARVGLKETVVETDWSLFSWQSSLEQMNYDCDVVFFGDSITRGGDFQKEFADKKIINLGISGDTISGLRRRVDMVKSVNPEKIFIMCGINGLKNSNYKEKISAYEELIVEIKRELPDTKIYLQSVLPLSKSNEKKLCSNATIESLNQGIEKLAEKHLCKYIDLYELFLSEGAMNEKYSEDGIHLADAGYENWYAAIKEYV